MTEIISNTVEPARIEIHIRRTETTARSRGGEIAAAAQTRLTPAIADIDAALEALHAAAKAETSAWADVLTVAERSKRVVGSIRDQMWNALGRPRQNRHLAQVFPDGVATYTTGDPRRQPVFLKVLQSRIAACPTPRLTDEQRDAWVAQLAEVEKAFEEALEKHRPTEAPASVTAATYRANIRLGHEQLRLFKRDLENLGLSRGEIFDIIPDGTPAPKAPKTEVKSEGSGTAGAGSPAPANTNAPPKAAEGTEPEKFLGSAFERGGPRPWLSSLLRERGSRVRVAARRARGQRARRAGVENNPCVAASSIATTSPAPSAPIRYSPTATSARPGLERTRLGLADRGRAARHGSCDLALD